MRLVRFLVAVGLVVGLPTVAAAAPCSGFTDVDSASGFCPSVTWLKNRGVTSGCSATLYCPNDPVTRLAMAGFLSRLDRVLPPSMFDANGAAVGALVSKDSGDVVVAYRASGRLHLLRFTAYVGTTNLEYWPEEGASVYFVTANCTGTAYSNFGTWLPAISNITATGYAEVVAGAGGALHLFASVSSPLPANVVPAQIVVSSRLQAGACTPISPAPLQYALPMALIENLSARFTGPFKLN